MARATAQSECCELSTGPKFSLYTGTSLAEGGSGIHTPRAGPGRTAGFGAYLRESDLSACPTVMAGACPAPTIAAGLLKRRVCGRAQGLSSRGDGDELGAGRVVHGDRVDRAGVAGAPPPLPVHRFRGDEHPDPLVRP